MIQIKGGWLRNDRTQPLVIVSHRNSSRIRRISPQPPREPSGARVDAALALDELGQALGIRLVRCRIPQSPAPLAPGPLVSLGRVGGAPNDGAERVFPIRHF